MNSVINYIQQIWTSSIRRQLMLGIILVHAVMMSIFVYDLVERQRDFLHTQSIQQTKSLVKTLATNSTSWVLANDVVGLEEILDAQVNYPALRYAMVLSPQGRVLGHTDKDKVGLYINDAASARLLKAKKEQILLVNNDLTIDVASPIMSNDVFIGWARVNLTQTENEKNLKIITQNGLLYTSLAIVLGAIFAFFMAKGITHGVQHIVDVAEEIKSGRINLRTKLNRQDELGKLAEDFNIMLDTINKSKRDLQNILDNSPSVIYVKDIYGNFTFVNKQFEKIFHISREEISGKSLFDIFPENIAHGMRQNDLDVIETKQALESEELVPQDDGMHTYTSIKFPLYDDNEKIYAVCGVSTDKTDKLKIEKEKAALENQLIHTQKMQAIGQLTGGIAHDFNNLLAVILGYAELSQELYAKDNEKLRENLNNIYTAGIRGRELIQQMLIFSRKDQIQDDIISMEIEPVLAETIKMLKATFPSNIKIETSLQKNIPNINSNPGLLSQILMNLCINAKDAIGKEGNLLISLSLGSFKNEICQSCNETVSGDYVLIGIKDDGQGINEEDLTRIFEPFFTSKKVGEGTGMGLSVVHGVVHKLNGHILVSSSKGEGTYFKILLPAAKNKVDVENKTESKTSFAYNFSDLSIMIVDDEPTLTNFFSDSLKNYNAKVIVFNDSQQALDFYKNTDEKIDIVITDQTMPDLSGSELSQRLLALNPDLPIILCTGYSTEITEEKAYQTGIKSFLFKPIKLEKLLNTINKLK